MLHQFLATNRDRITDRARAKNTSQPLGGATELELRGGAPLLLTQLIGMLQALPESSRADIGKGAARHGGELLRMGVSVEAVVRVYGGLCQAITELAVEDDVSIHASEFKTLNLCLDDAVAAAVSEFGRQREQSLSDDNGRHLGYLTHELLNVLHVARIAFDAISTGAIGVSGSSGHMVARNLERMRAILDRSIADEELRRRREARAGEGARTVREGALPAQGLLEPVLELAHRASVLE